MKKKLNFGYYYYRMICRKQLQFLEERGTPIANLWEVRLSPELWNRVKKIAKYENVSYSWIVRYCVFRLARRKCIRMFPAMENLSRKIRKTQPQSDKCHRHMLCLYGTDEQLLQLRAMQLRISVSLLIRLGLEWFLPKFEKGIEYDIRIRTGQIGYTGGAAKAIKKGKGTYIWSADFFWRGIKLNAKIRFNLGNLYNLPEKIIVEFARFKYSDWHNIWMDAWHNCQPGFAEEILQHG